MRRELETFGDGGGLVIDTKDLFRLRMCVRRGDITVEQARAKLRGSENRFYMSD
jgi:hypothetical protein